MIWFNKYLLHSDHSYLYRYFNLDTFRLQASSLSLGHVTLSLHLKSKRQRHVVDSIGGRRRQTSQFQQLREMLPAATEVPLEATAVAMAKTTAYLSINGYTTRLSQQLKRPVADPSFCHPNNVSGQ